MTKSYSYWLIGWILYCGVALDVHSDNIDKLMVMPGDLIQGHAKYEDECEKCHESYEQVSQPKLCRDCHDKVDEDIKQKRGFHGKNQLVGEDRACKSCHTDHKGRNFDIVLLDTDTFDHNLSDYPLEGAHQGVNCTGCHAPDKKYREAGLKCLDCHKEDDPHKGDLGEKCDDCHKVDTWNSAKFDHSKTDFPLVDKHKEVACASCHPDERYKDIPVDCYSCHKLNDVHAGKYGKACDDCHNEKKWSELKFNHNKDTDYPLLGRHKRVSCQACHGNDVNRPLKRTCVACHENDDVHRSKNGTECKDCHSVSGWAKLSFDHDKDTDYPLKGEHKSASCESCHRGRVDEELDDACVACHLGDDVHKGEEGKQCEQCHDEVSWTENVLFNHDLTKFPLIGLHAGTACEQCHLSSQYKEAPLECNACHESDDIHKKQLGVECQACHTPNDWKIWHFDHDKQSDYPLTGAHKGLDCLACHTEPVEDGKIKLSIQCNACHSRDDIHRGEFGRDCRRCHNTEAFGKLGQGD